MVAANGDQSCAVLAEMLSRDLNLRDGLIDVERVRYDVPSIDDLLSVEWLDVLHRIVGTQQPARLAIMGWAESGAGPVTDSTIERHADHDDVGVTDVLEARQTRKGGDAGKARRQTGVGRADGLG